MRPQTFFVFGREFDLANLVILTTVVGTILQFSLAYLLTHSMSVTDYGDIKVIRAFSEIGSILIILGGGRAALYFVPDWKAQNRSDLTWQFIRFYLSIALCIAVILVITLTAAQAVLQTFDFNMGIYGGSAILIATMGLPIAGASILNIKILQIYGKVIPGLISQWVLFPVLLAAILLPYRIIEGQITVLAAVISLFIVQTIIVITQFVFLGRLGVQPQKVQKKGTGWRQWLRFSIPVMLIGIFQQLVIKTDIIMLELFGDEADVGLFGVCSLSATILLVIKIAVSSTTTQYMKRAYENGNTQMRELTARGNRRLMLFCFPLAIATLIFGQDALAIFGAEYEKANLALQILMAGYIIQTLLLLSLIWLEYTEKKHQTLSIMIFIAILNIALNALLIPLWQLNGAALGTTISMTVGAGLSALCMWKHLKVAPLTIRL